MLGVIGFLLTIAIIVVIHEWGHYIVARVAGVKILAFSFGFGRVLWRRKDKRGCEWRLSLWPLGGYVKMLDVAEKTSLEAEGQTFSPADWANSFDKKSVWKRFAVVFAGPAMNLILAVVIYASLAMLGTYEPSAKLGEPVPETQAAAAGIEAGDTVDAVAEKPVVSRNDLRFELVGWMGEKSVPVTLTDDAGDKRTVYFDLSGFRGETQQDPLDYLGLTQAVKGIVVAQVLPGSAAEVAGLARGDTVLAVNGEKVKTVTGLIGVIRAHTGERVTLDVRRMNGDEDRVAVEVRPETVDGKTVGRIGASLGALTDFVFTREGPVGALGVGVARVWDTIRVTAKSIAGMIRGDVSVKSLSGPVTIGDLAGQTLSYGFIPYLLFLAMISISIGVLNLFPVPVLDGGHLMFYLYEMVTGRRPSDRVLDWGQKAGLVLLLLLMGVALSNDMMRLFGLN